MKRFCFAVWMCLIFGLTTLSGQDKAPSIVVDNPVKDFGKVMQGETLKHVFRLMNKGSITLEILDIGPTCGCQATSLSEKQILPGQSGQIEVVVYTEGLKGAINESVNLISNDPHRSSIFLTMKADVQPEISVSSPSIFFDNVPAGKEATREIIMTVAAGRPIMILSAESSLESVIVKLESIPDSEGKKFKLIATHKSDGKIGHRLGSIIVKTSSYLTPEFKISLLIQNLKR